MRTPRWRARHDDSDTARHDALPSWVPRQGWQRRELVIWGAHGGAGTSTLAAWLQPAWDMGAMRPEPDPPYPANVATGRALVIACRNTAWSAQQATKAVAAAIRQGGQVAVLAVVSDGWPEPATATSRFRLLEPQVGAVIRVPFIARSPARRRPGRRAAAPRRAPGPGPRSRRPPSRTFPLPPNSAGDLTMLLLALAVHHATSPAQAVQPLPRGLAVTVPNPAPQPPPGLSRTVNTLLAWWKWLAPDRRGVRADRLRRDDGDRPPQPAQPRRGRRDRHPVGARRAHADRLVVRHRRRLHLRPAMFTYAAPPSPPLAQAPPAGPPAGRHHRGRRGRAAIAAHAGQLIRTSRNGTSASRARHPPRRSATARPGQVRAQRAAGPTSTASQLPVSATAGPHHIHNGLSGGFTDTPLGAVLAAVNIAVRTAAQWGPRIYRPTINHHVIGPAAGITAGRRQQRLRRPARRRPRRTGPASRPRLCRRGRLPAGPPTRRRSATADIVSEGPASNGTTVHGRHPDPGPSGSAATGGWSPRPAAPGPAPRRRSPPCPVTPPSRARGESCPATH